VVERFARGVTVLQDTCPGLVGQIEMGELDAPETETILRAALDPMLEKGIDTVVLGCTHYPFVIPLIEHIVGSNVRVIDPAPAVARQTRRLFELTSTSAIKQNNHAVSYYSTAAPEAMGQLLPKLLGETGFVTGLHWNRGKLDR
jgi:glutamate racemase